MELSLARLRPLATATLALALALLMLTGPARAQVSTPCNASMIASFSPCMNFVTNSTGNGTSPTSDCCNALKTFTGSGMDCLCLIVTGSVPFQIPINRSLAISLPRACNMPGVPLQCKASGAPNPAPGPSFGPTLSPGVSPTTSPAPTGSTVDPVSPALSPESDTPLLTPPSTDGTEAETPTETTGSRTGLTPSAATPSLSLSTSVFLIATGCAIMKFY